MSTQPAVPSPPAVSLMPAAGSFGPIPFVLTRPLQSASHTHSQSWYEHDVAGGKSVPEHTGEPLDRIELSFRLWAEALLPSFPAPTIVQDQQTFGGRFPEGTPSEVVRAALAVQEAVVSTTLGRIVPPIAGAFVGTAAQNAVRNAIGARARSHVNGHTQLPELTGYDVAEDLDEIQGMARSALGYPLFLGARFMGHYAIGDMSTEHVFVHPGHGGLLVADLRLSLLEMPSVTPYTDPAAPPPPAP